ncbi:MAG TPA: hypothetical protein VFA07_03520 [Chthonomonadaceae bacterium]|nr:hypothetical protein [Chthonomonadaceae bacterium]
MVIIQQIHTLWTKKSRGGPGAVQRNAVPEVAKVPLQQVQVSEVSLLLHRLTYRESKGFSCPYECQEENPSVRPILVGCVTIDHGEDIIVASFRYTMECGGAPYRGGKQKTLQIGTNEWGQIVYNGRFAPEWEGDWWYEKMVVNVGLFEPPSNSVFTRSKPTYRYAAIGHLY